MSEEKKRSRRVVTKREYLSFLGQRLAYATALLFTLALCLALGAFTCLLLERVIANFWRVTLTAFEWFLILLLALLLGVAIYLAALRVRNYARELRTIEPVIPLTRHNTGDLPEDETLVRASEEPPAHQADVLLRAAQGGQETPEEQLLRPVER